MPTRGDTGDSRLRILRRGLTILALLTRRSWHVSDGQGRTRWGTLAQVQADVDALLDGGAFPESKAYLWA